MRQYEAWEIRERLHELVTVAHTCTDMQEDDFQALSRIAHRIASYNAATRSITAKIAEQGVEETLQHMNSDDRYSREQQPDYDPFGDEDVPSLQEYQMIKQRPM